MPRGLEVVEGKGLAGSFEEASRIKGLAEFFKTFNGRSWRRGKVQQLSTGPTDVDREELLDVKTSNVALE